MLNIFLKENHVVCGNVGLLVIVLFYFITSIVVSYSSTTNMIEMVIMEVIKATLVFEYKFNEKYEKQRNSSK